MTRRLLSPLVMRMKISVHKTNLMLEISLHRSRKAPNSLTECSIKLVKVNSSNQKLVFVGVGRRCVIGSVNSDRYNDFSRNWLKASLAVKQVPLLVRIVEGSDVEI
ncbi:hypothetical protein DEO72_LG7g1973 [Vigna unguiculata]|uniref:Uncharacterized protein n=1 Tax=Vigna unguiculata TaxID=3917 RepID=A0A4D6MGY2_VIGUN|nr:hypothetical protein DEO72_LG7g1973 [Vigna unguiculata]